MPLVLALAALLRHRARTVLAVLGVAVSAAMLLDMVMLSSGMRASFRSMLTQMGFQLRLAPAGTLPFDTEATIDRADRIVRALRAEPDVAVVSPVLGSSVHVPVGDASVSSTALGIDPRYQGDYRLLSGHDIAAPDQLVADDDFLRAARARVGDTIRVAAGYDPQLRAYAGTRRLTIVGRARFVYLSAGQRAIAMPLATLQAMGGAARADRVSLLMVKVRPGASVDALQRRIARTYPQVNAISTAAALRQVDQRLSYFRQLAFILGTVSLVVGFLLVTTLVSVSVHERIGEIAVMRAIGISRRHVVEQVVLESVGLMLAGAALGLLLGLVTARWLNGILSDFPGLPAAIDFFLFQPRDAWLALGMLVVSGIASGIWPAWRGASLPIATTLRQEAVA